MNDSGEIWASGRRKTSVARVILRPGTGKCEINGQSLEAYFPLNSMRIELQQPLIVTEMQGKFDIFVNAEGGGIHGQVGATRLGIARALLRYNPELRSVLRRSGLLTRDPRAKERKKYGQKGARKRFQFSKR